MFCPGKAIWMDFSIAERCSGFQSRVSSFYMGISLCDSYVFCRYMGEECKYNISRHWLLPCAWNKRSIVVRVNV